MLARDASTQIDAVYSNPAGLAFIDEGFHFSFNGQSVYQTRGIQSTFAPFAGFGGNAMKTYKGEASAPFVPSLFAAYKKGDWRFPELLPSPVVEVKRRLTTDWDRLNRKWR